MLSKLAESRDRTNPTADSAQTACPSAVLGTFCLALGSPIGTTAVQVTTFESCFGQEWLFYRFVRRPDGTPSQPVRMNDGKFLDYIFGAEDRPGPYSQEWDSYLGRYRYRIFGQPSGSVRVHQQNGNLFLDTFLDDMKLAEFQPGLFFTSHGETLDLRGAVPTWRNVPLERITITPALRASRAT